MKTSVAYGVLGCTILAIIFITTTFAADKTSAAVGDPTEPQVTVQTDVKFTRKRPNGKTEISASPSVRSFVGQSAVLEMTMPNGETVTINIGTSFVPSDCKPLPANKSADVK